MLGPHTPAAYHSLQKNVDRPRSAMPQHKSESALSFPQSSLRMLGPHVRQQLVLPGKGARTGRAAPRLNTGVRQLTPSPNRHCACLILMCASSLSFLAKVRGQAAQRHAETLERVSSLSSSSYCACSVLTCACNLPLLAKMRGQAAQRHVRASQERVSSLSFSRYCA
jgi:hypothetical protein